MAENNYEANLDNSQDDVSLYTSGDENNGTTVGAKQLVAKATAYLKIWNLNCCQISLTQFSLF